jgi:hypothetical protein
MDDPLVTNTVELIRIMQSKMSGHQRTEMWNLIKEGYCDDCGRKLTDKNDICYLHNDE